MDKTSVHDYYVRVYRYDIVRRLLAQWGPNGCEVLIKGSTIPVVRNRSESEFYELLCDFHPPDGLHCSAGHSGQSALVLDLDHERARDLLCDCASLGAKRICDFCWIAMAGTARVYAYALRRQFGCRELLCSFSGGRGCHIVALRPQVLDRSAAMKWFIETLPTNITNVATSYMTMVKKYPGKAIPLTMFNPHSRISRLLVASSADRDLMCSNYADPFVVELFKTTALPYFLDEWRTRVVAPTSTEDEAVACAGALLAAPHRHSDHTRCEQCVLVDAFAHASDMHRTQQTSGRIVFSLHDRIDVFLAVMMLFYVKPDEGLLSPTHMLRVPFSPHERTGNVSLPLDLKQMHTLCPGTHPPRMSELTTDSRTRALYLESIRLVDDLLTQLERRPGVGIRSTADTMSRGGGGKLLLARRSTKANGQANLANLAARTLASNTSGIVTAPQDVGVQMVLDE